MSLRFSHLFWDFDGTLYDTYESMTSSMLYALDDMGHFALPAEVYALLKRSVHHASLALAERFSLAPEALRNAFRKHHDAAGEFRLFPGVDRCLYSLKRLGCKHYLYTHRGRSAVRQLEKDDLTACFTGYVTREDAFPPKPAPDALNAMMAQYALRQGEAAIIGDRDLDILAGHNAGIASILFDPQGFFPELSAEYRARDMGAIEGIVTGKTF